MSSGLRGQYSEGETKNAGSEGAEKGKRRRRRRGQFTRDKSGEVGRDRRNASWGGDVGGSEERG